MATIKLQPSGKVLIKDGKVSCGCCENCGPMCRVKIPESILTKVQNATASFTLFGFNPDFFYRISPTQWDAFFDFGGIVGVSAVAYLDGCLGFFLAGSIAPYNGIAETGAPEYEYECGLDLSRVYSKFSINGINDFDFYYYDDYEDYDDYPPPIFVFS